MAKSFKIPSSVQSTKRSGFNLPSALPSSRPSLPKTKSPKFIRNVVKKSFPDQVKVLKRREHSADPAPDPFVPSSERLAAMIAYAEANSIYVPPDSYLQQLDDYLVSVDTILDKYVVYYVFAVPVGYSDFARINIITPGTFTCTLEGLVGDWAGSHVALGFQGDGTDSYIDTGFNPSTDGNGLYTLDSASMTVDASSYDTDSNGCICGLRSATAQLIVIPKALVDGNTKYIIHDNTNTNLTNSAEDRGLYIVRRTSSTAKRLFRRGSISSVSQSSVEIPNGTITLLSRRRVDTATIDAFYPGIISMFGVSAPLTNDEEVQLRNSWTNFKLKYQSPLFTVTEIEGVKEVIGLGAGAAWDSGSVFGGGRHNNVQYYGGTDDTGSDVTGYSIGAFDFSGLHTGTKNAGNPIFDVSGLSPNVSIMPMDVYVSGSTIYILASLRDNSVDPVISTAILTASTSDPYTLTYVGELLTAGDGPGNFNHGASWFDDPEDPTYIKIVYAFRNTSSVNMRINVAMALKSSDITNPANWSVQHSDIVASVIASADQVYPKIYYFSGQAKPYKLIYSRFFPESFDDGFSSFSTESDDLSSFPAGLETLWPTGVTGDPDAQYTSIVRLDQSNGLVFYNAREGGGSTPYESICVRQYQNNFGS